MKETRRFGVDLESLSSLRGWMEGYGVVRVAMESTGIYWVPIYASLEAGFKVLLANARQVKAIPGRKMDQKDSEWLAYLLRADLIKPSYVPLLFRGTRLRSARCIVARSIPSTYLLAI